MVVQGVGQFNYTTVIPAIYEIQVEGSYVCSGKIHLTFLDIIQRGTCMNAEDLICIDVLKIEYFPAKMI